MIQENMLKNWCTVSLDNIISNYKLTAKNTSKRVICVIKSDAYGHGAKEVGKALTEAGCDMFAVSSFNEAKELRDCGITCSILILGRVMPHEIPLACKLDIALAAGSLDFIKEAADAVKSCQNKLKIHIKLNTGMNRTGFNTTSEQGLEELRKASRLICENASYIETEGVFSHFAKAEDDRQFSCQQYERFKKGTQLIEESGLSPKLLHICNSAGILNNSDMYLDAVRLGIALYGCEAEKSGYLPVMSLYARILEIHKLSTGDGVSYGLDFKAEKPTTVAVIGIGYGDGLLRSLSNGKGYVLYKGVKCPIVGRVCMDMTMIDISGVHDAKVYDPVTVFGKSKEGFISCSEQAENAGTISYELLCSVSKRVPRIYI